MFCISLANLRKWVKIPYNLLDVNNDGVIDKENDYIDCGRATPLAEFSLVNTFQLHGFTLMLDLGSLVGYHVLSSTQWLTSKDIICNAPKALYYEAWTPEHQNTAIPASMLPHHQDMSQISEDDNLLSKGDFLRVRNISLLYDFKRDVLKNSKFFKGFIFGVNVENPFLWTAYAGGPDPELGALGQTGNDWMAYPRPMTITANLKITF